MTESSPHTLGRADARRRFATAGGIVVLVVAACVGILAMIPGLLPSLNEDPNRLASVLQQTIEAKGVDAAVEQYRTLRAQGFPGPQENESDTNRLGYARLANGDTEGAIQVFQLNVETHPHSANVYDSLGEAYLAAGNRPLAIESYEKAIAIDPRKKSAVSELQALTSREREPYRPLVLFHILAGMTGLSAGAVAMSLRKGSRRHGVTGTVFVVSMLSMSASAAYMAFVNPEGDAINVLMGILTFYLVATAWSTARRRSAQTSLVDWAALLVAVAVAAGLANFGLEAANSQTGSKDGAAAGVYFAFAAVASLAAVLDLRMILRGGVSGAQRLTRHLWRMCAALFIGVTSLFLGQLQLFPVALRNTGLLVVPSLLVLVSLGFWLVRVNAFQRTAAARPQPVVPEAVATT